MDSIFLCSEDLRIRGSEISGSWIRANRARPQRCGGLINRAMHHLSSRDVARKMVPRSPPDVPRIAAAIEDLGLVVEQVGHPFLDVELFLEDLTDDLKLRFVGSHAIVSLRHWPPDAS